MAKKVKKKKGKFDTEVIKIKTLCKQANIGYFKLYFRKNGQGKNLRQSELSLNDRTDLLNALMKDITPFVNDLGFDLRATAL